MYTIISYATLFLFTFQVYGSNSATDSSNPVPRDSLDLGSIFEDIFGSLIPDGTTNSTSENVGNAIDGIIGLFSTTLVKDVVSSITHMADLFDNQTSAQTKSLIQIGADELINETINEVTSLLDSANVLLTADNVESINNLLEEASPLLTEDFLNEINNLLNNTSTLLTFSFVNETKSLITQVDPLLPYLSSNSSALNIPQLLTSVNQYIPPHADDIGNLLTNVNDLLAANLTKQIAMSSTAPIFTTELVDKLNTTLDNASNLLKSDLINEVNNILDEVTPFLTTSNVQKINSLLSNGNNLLTAQMVNNTEALISAASGLLSDQTVLTKAEALIPIALEFLSDEAINKISTLFQNGNGVLTSESASQTGSLVDSLASFLTNQTLDEVETSGITPELLQQVATLLDNAGQLLTTDGTDQILQLIHNVSPVIDPTVLGQVKNLTERGHILVYPNCTNTITVLIDAVSELFPKVV
ncbi:hypothetical protein AFGD_003998 [Aspergillus flavus]|nr:hypothetical protein AFGD_003998 [Aspergillus flavus]